MTRTSISARLTILSAALSQCLNLVGGEKIASVQAELNHFILHLVAEVAHLFCLALNDFGIILWIAQGLMIKLKTF